MYEPFIDVHICSKRSTPNQMINYKLAVLHYKLYNVNLPQADKMDLNTQQSFSSQKTRFKITIINKFRCRQQYPCNEAFNPQQ